MIIESGADLIKNEQNVTSIKRTRKHKSDDKVNIQHLCFDDVKSDYDNFRSKIDSIKNIEEGTEDDFKTEELYKKMKFEEGLCAFYTLSSIVTAIIYYESKKSNTNDSMILFSLIVVSILTILFIFSTIIRNYLHFRIRVSIQELTQRHSFIDSSNFNMMIFEITWAMIAPNYGFHLVKITTAIGWNLLEVNYNLNDLLLVIQIPRIYTVYRFLIACTSYSGEKAHRVGKMMGLKTNILFSIRCIFYSHPVKMLLVLFFINVIGLSYMIKILEGPVYYISTQAQNNEINYNLMENCLWNVLVTMTTVGYGDFYPLTNLGRLVMIVCAFLGTTLISLMTLITGNKLSLSETERKIFNFSQRLESRRVKDETFVNYTMANLKLISKSNQLKKYVNQSSNLSLLDSRYLSLKREIEELLYEKIELKKESKKSFNYFRANFEPLDDNFAIQSKIKEMANKIEFMFKNFESLEKSLDFIESLENKKLETNEKIHMLNKINTLQSHIDGLEKKLVVYENSSRIPSSSNLHRKLKSVGIRGNNSIDTNSFNYIEGVVENNLSHTREIKKSTGLFNIKEYGYISPHDTDEEQIN